LFGPGETLAFGILHLGVCVAAAVMASPRAFALALLVSLLAALRYLGMALVAHNLVGNRNLFILALSMWLFGYAALGAVLCVAGIKAPGLLVWGGAAAIAGPITAFLRALSLGIAAIFGHGLREAQV